MSSEQRTSVREYGDHEVICRQGERGRHMYVLEAGRAEVVREDDESEVVLAELRPGDVFGELALFEAEPRSATVRAKGKTRALVFDKAGFLKRVHEDPALAFRILAQMAERVRAMNEQLEALQRSSS